MVDIDRYSELLFGRDDAQPVFLVTIPIKVRAWAMADGRICSSQYVRETPIKGSAYTLFRRRQGDDRRLDALQHSFLSGKTLLIRQDEVPDRALVALLAWAVVDRYERFGHQLRDAQALREWEVEVDHGLVRRPEFFTAANRDLFVEDVRKIKGVEV
jgi:hypothetical protein